MDGDRHVVLIGREGPGRSHIGRRLARLLQRPFADVDEQVELTAGRTLAQLAREGGPDDLRLREAQVLAHLLAQDVPLVILAPGAVGTEPACKAALARSAVVLWLRGHEARAWPDGASDRYEDIADHIVDLEPFHATAEEPERAVARHILQLLVTGELRGSVRVPARVGALMEGRLREDLPEAVTLLEQELSARVEDIADHIVDVEPFHTGDDEPERAIARHIARLLADDDPRTSRRPR
jgi:hypothetical protein